MYILKSDSLRTFFGIGQGDSLLRISRPLIYDPGNELNK
jgi:hypothetical protein